MIGVTRGAKRFFCDVRMKRLVTGFASHLALSITDFMRITSISSIRVSGYVDSNGEMTLYNFLLPLA